MNQDLFPDRSPKFVSKVMNLIHDNKTKILQCMGIGVNHVTQNFGGHHYQGRLGIDACVTSQKTNSVLSVHLFEILIFLIRKRLDGGGVEAFLPLLDR